MTVGLERFSGNGSRLRPAILRRKIFSLHQETPATTALKELKPQTFYPFLPIEAAFNWNEVWPHTGIEQATLVVFHSTLAPGADVEQLVKLDDAARKDAAKQPGYIYYFRGTEGPRNISFCLWENPEFARIASNRPVHKEASTYASEAYNDFKLSIYTIKRVGENVEITPFERNESPQIAA